MKRNIETKNVIIYDLIIRCRRFKFVKYPMAWRHEMIDDEVYRQYAIQ